MEDSVLLTGHLNCNIPFGIQQKYVQKVNYGKTSRMKNNLSVVGPPVPSGFPTGRGILELLDVVILKNITLWLRSIESLSELDSDHRLVVFKLGIDTPSGPSTKTIINSKKFVELIRANDSPLSDLISGIIESVGMAKEAASKFTTFIQ